MSDIYGARGSSRPKRPTFADFKAIPESDRCVELENGKIKLKSDRRAVRMFETAGAGLGIAPSAVEKNNAAKQAFRYALRAAFGKDIATKVHDGIILRSMDDGSPLRGYQVRIVCRLAEQLRDEKVERNVKSLLQTRSSGASHWSEAYEDVQGDRGVFLHPNDVDHPALLSHLRATLTARRHLFEDELSSGACPVVSRDVIREFAKDKYEADSHKIEALRGALPFWFPLDLIEAIKSFLVRFSMKR